MGSFIWVTILLETIYTRTYHLLTLRNYNRKIRRKENDREQTLSSAHPVLNTKMRKGKKKKKKKKKKKQGKRTRQSIQLVNSFPTDCREAILNIYTKVKKKPTNSDMQNIITHQSTCLTRSVTN